MAEDMLLYHTELHLYNDRDIGKNIDNILLEYQKQYKLGKVPFMFEWGDGTGKVVFYDESYKNIMCRLTWIQALSSTIWPDVRIALLRAYEFLGILRERIDINYGILPRYTNLICRNCLDNYGMSDCK